MGTGPRTSFLKVKSDNGWKLMAVGHDLQNSIPPKFFRVSQVRCSRDSEQVAAICYRVRERGIEFLLVRTRAGRWTFPKGGVEPGLTHAQTAALEAFEEAGVHGRMEEAEFTSYVRRERKDKRTVEVTVHAYLCEVLRLGPPQESKRNRTWFSAEKAMKHLREGRSARNAAQLTPVLEFAATRIQQLRAASSRAASQPVAALHPAALQPAMLRPASFDKDGLQAVQFEAGRPQRLVRSVERPHVDAVMPHDSYGPAAIELAVNAYLVDAGRIPEPDLHQENTRLSARTKPRLQIFPIS
jgi:8-oxo-dGTP pyrophosphatase MutT (NUDIX family)